jgi:hypothetical protein
MLKDVPSLMQRGELVPFDPTAALLQEARTSAVIEYAKKVKNWPTLEIAVDQKIEDQREFVDWWDDNVRGRGERANVADRGHFVEDAEKLSGITKQLVSRWRRLLEDTEAYRRRLFGPSYKEAMGALADGQLVQQSLSNEHYTPAKYIEAARAVLGEIDLDPASCKRANKIVKAKKFFSEDGEVKPWAGRVWLNPPYGRLAGQFVAKLSAEIGAKHVSAAIVLVNAHCTDTDWFTPLWDSLLCFTDHRINFYGDDERSGSTHGSVFAYFGANIESFSDNFREFGAIVRRL